MKKTFAAVFLAAAVFFVGIPSFAAEGTGQTGASVAISLSSIDSLVRQYNPSITTLHNKLMLAKQTYSDEKGTSGRDAAAHQYDLAEATYEEQVQQVIVNAKQTYLSYWYAVSVLSTDQAQADHDAKLLVYSRNCLQNGYLSQKDYQTASDNEAKSSQALAAQTASVAQTERSVKTLVSVPVGTTVDILPPADADFDFSGISKIIYADDMFYMKLNNEDVRSASLEYDYKKDNAGVLYSDEEVANAKLAVDQTAQQQEAAFLNLYNIVTASYATYQMEQQTVQKRESELQTDAQKLAKGYLSQKDYDQASLDLQTMKNSLENDRNLLYSSYAKYIGMKNGYSAGSTNA